MGIERTHRTIRMLRHALKGAQLHHRLIMLSRMLRVHEVTGQFRKCLLPLRRINRDIHRKQAREYPEDIPVDHRIGLVPGKRNNGSRRVLPYPLQRNHILVAAGKYAAETLHNLFGRRMEVTRPAVIAQPLPIFQHLVFVCLSQRSDIGETFHKTVKIVHPLRDTRLLEDNLRNPNDIRV